MRGGKDLLVQAWPAFDCLILTEILRNKTQETFQRDPRREAGGASTGSNSWAGTSASVHPGAPLSAAA